MRTATNALDALHSKTLDCLKPAGDVPQTNKRERNIRCRLCVKTFPTVRDLNTHHRDEHGIVGCDQCDKKFTSQSSLDKHQYYHRELKHICDICGKKFPFESRLLQHSFVHINQRHSCPIKTCDRKFKGLGDLNRHIQTHKKGGWYYCEFCDYKNKDKRNTDSHICTHQDKDQGTIVCDKCHKIMRFSTQYKRHRETGCKVVKLS